MSGALIEVVVDVPDGTNVIVIPHNWPTAVVSPFTSTGVRRWVVVPSPTWPLPLRPQHLVPPLVVNAHVWERPVAIWRTPLVIPLTSTGVRRLVVAPSPRSPLPLSPQHLAPPLVVTAHVWSPPTV